MALNPRDLDLIFGPDSEGSTAEERARTSSRLFNRSQDQLVEHSEQSHGRRLSAWEALQAFGIDVLREAIDYGSAILPATAKEPAATLTTRRESLGFSIREIARMTSLPEKEIDDAENPATRTPIRTIERIAQVLALDERVISFRPEAGGDASLAVRLRALRSGKQNYSLALVSRLCEAAWVIKRQHEINLWLAPEKPVCLVDRGFEPSPNYGTREYPAWMHGYFLAGEAREKLGIPLDAPIESLRDLVERNLGIPVVQMEMHQDLAGATVANGNVRGIVINVRGSNENVWVRRATLAHELGHLLWDPDERLETLEVDRYDDLFSDPQEQRDYVEARANAFAVEFLAPARAAGDVFQNSDNPRQGLRAVMETFGLSYTSARYHVWNALGRKTRLEDLIVDDWLPTDDWKGRESFTVDYFQPESVPISRRGLFAQLVVRAADAGLLTNESAATYLRCNSLDEYTIAADFVREILA